MEIATIFVLFFKREQCSCFTYGFVMCCHNRMQRGVATYTDTRTIIHLGVVFSLAFSDHAVFSSDYLMVAEKGHIFCVLNLAKRWSDDTTASP